jgi:hypothetical protein
MEQTGNRRKVVNGDCIWVWTSELSILHAMKLVPEYPVALLSVHPELQTYIFPAATTCPLE